MRQFIFNDFADQDYVHKLNSEERAYLKRFNSEFYSGSGLRDKSAIHPWELRKTNYQRGNCSRRDLWYSVSHNRMAKLFSSDSYTKNPEDSLIDWIDCRAQENKTS